MRPKSVPIRVWLIAAAMLAVALLSLPELLYREGPAAIIPALTDDGLLYAEIVPPRLVPLARNRTWGASWERFPIADVPRHPLDVINAGDPHNEDLRRWVCEWERSAYSNADVGTGRRLYLGELLKTSDLCALALFEIGSSFDLAGDTATSLVWYRRGIEQARRELRDAAGRQDSYGYLIQSLAGAQAVLWKAHGAGESGCVDEISDMNDILLEILPKDDQERRNWAVLCRASVDLSREHPESALRTLGALHASGGKPSAMQRMDEKWVEAIALHLAGDDRRSSLLLGDLANTPAFWHAKDAHVLLMVTLAQCGDAASADRELDRYVARYQPPIARVVPLERLLRECREGLAGRNR